MTQLNFAQEYRYPDDEEGISIEVKLFYAGHGFEVWAKVDSGASVCSAMKLASNLASRLSKESQFGWVVWVVR